jgi:hypothetical protein
VAAARQAWWTEAEDGVGGISPERLVFLDECGVLTNMVRLHGRSPRGARACASAPFGHWARVTVLGALGVGGVVGAMVGEAATGAAVFHAYLDQVLLPELRRVKPDAVLVMDNLAAHKAPRVRALLDASGFAYRHLPSCSPDLSPVRGTAPDADLGQSEGRAAPRCGPDRGGAARGARPRPRRRHPAGRCGMHPPLRLRSSDLTCKVL